MKLKPFASLFGAVLMATASTVGPSLPLALAEEARAEQTNTSEEKGAVSEAAQGVRDLTLAYDLATYGRQNQDPQSLIAAARIIINTPVQSLDRDKTSETDAGETAPATDEKTDGESIPFSADTLLVEARTLAASEPTLLAAIDSLEQSNAGARGRVGGPGRSVSSVRPSGTDSYRIPFKAGQRAQIGVRGDGDTDLDCYLYDQNGNLITSDTDYTDTCLLRWTPRWTGPFVLRIKNRGPIWNRYAILTN